MTEHDFNIAQQLKTLKKKDDYDPVLKSMSANCTLFNWFYFLKINFFTFYY